jgi:hypothetical protein
VINVSDHVCDHHPEGMMAFDKEKKQWFCEKCDAFAGSIKREIDLPAGSTLTSKTSSANSLTDIGPSESTDSLAEKAARMKAEELNFLEFIKKQEEEGKKSTELDRENGYYIGSFIYADTTRVTQHLGLGKFVVHAQFDPPLTQGDAVTEIKYKDGLGVVVPAKHVDKSVGG